MHTFSSVSCVNKYIVPNFFPENFLNTPQTSTLFPPRRILDSKPFLGYAIPIKRRLELESFDCLNSVWD